MEYTDQDLDGVFQDEGVGDVSDIVVAVGPFG